MTAETAFFSVASAVDGKRHRVELPLGSSVHALQNALEKCAHIAVRDQILLYGPPFKRLDTRGPVARAHSKSVFVFNRKFLSSTAQMPDVVVNVPGEITIPTAADMVNRTLPLSDTAPPLLRALVDYERSFLLHSSVAEAFQCGSDRQLLACRRCLDEQRTLREALAAVRR